MQCAGTSVKCDKCEGMARWTDPYASTSARTYTLWNRPDAKKVRNFGPQIHRIKLDPQAPRACRCLRPSAPSVTLVHGLKEKRDARSSSMNRTPSSRSGPRCRARRRSAMRRSGPAFCAHFSCSCRWTQPRARSLPCFLVRPHLSARSLTSACRPSLCRSSAAQSTSLPPYVYFRCSRTELVGSQC